MGLDAETRRIVELEPRARDGQVERRQLDARVPFVQAFCEPFIDALQVHELDDECGCFFAGAPFFERQQDGVRARHTRSNRPTGNLCAPHR